MHHKMRTALVLMTVCNDTQDGVLHCKNSMLITILKTENSHFNIC